MGVLPLSATASFRKYDGPRKSVPSYRLHWATGQARSINGEHIYLGKVNSLKSGHRDARLLAEMSEAGDPDDLRPTCPLMIAGR